MWSELNRSTLEQIKVVKVSQVEKGFCGTTSPASKVHREEEKVWRGVKSYINMLKFCKLLHLCGPSVWSISVWTLRSDFTLPPDCQDGWIWCEPACWFAPPAFMSPHMATRLKCKYTSQRNTTSASDVWLSPQAPIIQTPPDTTSPGNRGDADSHSVAIETKLWARGVW